MKKFLLSSIFLCMFAHYSCSNGGYKVSTSVLSVSLSADGEITSITVKGKKVEKPVFAFTTIEGCRQEGATIAKKLDDGSISFERTLVHDLLQKSCVLIDKFIPTANSVRWELSVKGDGDAWGSVIRTQIQYPAGENTLFWTTWGTPQYDPATVDEALAKRLRPFPGKHQIWFLNEENNFWADPLVPVPFSEVTYHYGAPYFGYEEEKRRINFAPIDGNLFCIPIATVVEPQQGIGLTFALSPEDNVINLKMTTSAQGDIVFDRLFNRISSANEVLFSMDITAHEDDWRPGLGWMSKRYPQYFDPTNPNAHILGGTGAYSNFSSELNVDNLRKKCFTVNWAASHDFPYIGMFLPPVGKDEPWQRFGGQAWRPWETDGGGTITIKAMNDQAAMFKAEGFYVLSYMNVCEFGAHIKFPPPPATRNKDDKDLWKDANDFLYTMLADGILPLPDVFARPENIGAFPPQHWGSWEGCIIMDCGDETYRNFLLEQARRHLTEIPDAFGICIDRLDWLRLFNERADDGITWFNGKPARSLVTSWKTLMEELGPIMHDANKFILANNHYKRLDLMKKLDGVFDEFAYAGPPLNYSAFLCVNKPALGWTEHAEYVKREGLDNFFQKYLYMGVFPMCPFPENDHAILPDEEIEKLYMDYGPLMRLMQSRRWVLEPHAVSVENNLAKANMFKIPDGYSIPVVYGEADVVRVKIANLEGLNQNSVCEVYYPGKDTPVVLKLNKNGSGWAVDVPLERGCAMLKLINK